MSAAARTTRLAPDGRAPGRSEPPAPVHVDAVTGPAVASAHEARVHDLAPMAAPRRSHRHVSSAKVRAAAAAIHALARWSPYVESEVCGLDRLVRPGAVCIDVGAAGGIYTMALSRLAGPTGTVLSVEPLPFANRHVARLLRAERASNVRRRALALGAEPALDVMHVPVGRFGLVTGRSYLDRLADGPDPNDEFAGQLDVRVAVDTLDALCAREALERVDFVKIDVEGAELQVLDGGSRVVQAYRPAVLVEIEARHAARYGLLPEQSMSWFLERGYSMHTWRHGWRAAASIEPSVRNYLFVPRRLEDAAPEPERPLAIVA
ncbi:MAG: FkbM family methyltransferase [Acidimicrobiales bacterium]